MNFSDQSVAVAIAGRLTRARGHQYEVAKAGHAWTVVKAAEKSALAPSGPEPDPKGTALYRFKFHREDGIYLVVKHPTTGKQKFLSTKCMETFSVVEGELTAIYTNHMAKAKKVAPFATVIEHLTSEGEAQS